MSNNAEKIILRRVCRGNREMPVDHRPSERESDHDLVAEACACIAGRQKLPSISAVAPRGARRRLARNETSRRLAREISEGSRGVIIGGDAVRDNRTTLENLLASWRLIFREILNCAARLNGISAARRIRNRLPVWLLAVAACPSHRQNARRIIHNHGRHFSR